MARRISMSAVPGGKIGRRAQHVVSVLFVQASNFGDGGHDFPGHPEAAGDVVSRNVVRDESEERRQRVGFAASAGAGQL